MANESAAREPGAIEQIQGQDRGSAEEETYGVSWWCCASEHHGGQGEHVDIEPGMAGARSENTGEAWAPVRKVASETGRETGRDRSENWTRPVCWSEKAFVEASVLSIRRYIPVA
jgi:hypothetical protein